MNAWSLLYEELDMISYDYNSVNDFWDEDGGDLIGNPYYITGMDTLSFTSSTTSPTILGGESPFVKEQGCDTLSVNGDVNLTRRWKYDEESILKELTDYISGTYSQHYSAGTDKVQTLDLIEACGDGESFCRSNILKYASRYDKKGTARRDILKILHYAVLLLHFNDKNAQRETYPQ